MAIGRPVPTGLFLSKRKLKRDLLCHQSVKIAISLTSLAALIFVSYSLEHLQRCLRALTGEISYFPTTRPGGHTTATPWRFTPHPPHLRECDLVDVGNDTSIKLKFCPPSKNSFYSPSLSIYISENRIFGVRGSEVNKFYNWAIGCLDRSSFCPARKVVDTLGNIPHYCPLMSRFQSLVYLCLYKNYQYIVLSINGTRISGESALAMFTIMREYWNNA